MNYETASIRQIAAAHSALPCTQTQVALNASTVSTVWVNLRDEAERAIIDEPILTSFMQEAVLNQHNLVEAVATRITERLSHADIDAATLRTEFLGLAAREPQHFEAAFVRDLMAVYDRDPACTRLLDALLYFKGFHALATHRFANAFWRAGRRDFALYLQSCMSSIFAVDIHPAASIGVGIMLDHGTGFVVGETVVIENDVSILHGVTLGGTGKELGDRHPKIRHGVLIGAGAKILGNIEIGACARVAAGSVVLANVPERTTVAGVPARYVGEAMCADPALNMAHFMGEHTPPYIGEGI